MDMVRVRALASFTEVTPRGMVVFNGPKNGNPGTEADLTEKRAAERVEAGMAEYVDPDDAPAPEPVPAPASTGGDGEGPSPFTMTHEGRGFYRIEGPGLEPDTKIRGRTDAEAFLKLAEEAHAEAEAALAAQQNADDDEDAPA